MIDDDEMWKRIKKEKGIGVKGGITGKDNPMLYRSIPKITIKNITVK
ncbi:MAG: hypothetical protein PF693_19295 [Spirochaetia bacterium]|jgi:hypothetical protein|nr:hypothetical protein [Spirochaetia bacterium]